jgi:hypothetical protein
VLKQVEAINFLKDWRLKLTTSNVVDSVISTSTVDAAAPKSVKTTYDALTTTVATLNTTFGTVNTNYQAAYAQANTARSDANTTFATVNTTFGTTNTTFGTHNTTFATLNTTFGTVNTSLSTMNSTFTGNVTGTLKGYKDYLTTTTSTGATTVDLSTSNWFKYTLSGSSTYTFSNAPASGNAFTVTLLLVQGTSGGKTVSWGNTIYWAGGQVPPATTTATGNTDLWTFTTIDGGTSFYGTLAIKDAR